MKNYLPGRNCTAYRAKVDQSRAAPARIRTVLLGLLLGVAATGGCRKASPQVEARPTFPVEGRVLVRGKPAEGVQIFLHPHDESQPIKPRGVTDAEGKFGLHTFQDGDGAPAGEYTITLYWPGRHSSKSAAEDQLPPDRLGERFMNPKSSLLRAAVAAGPTTLPTLNIK